MGMTGAKVLEVPSREVRRKLDLKQVEQPGLEPGTSLQDAGIVNGDFICWAKSTHPGWALPVCHLGWGVLLGCHGGRLVCSLADKDLEGSMGSHRSLSS